MVKFYGVLTDCDRMPVIIIQRCPGVRSHFSWTITQIEDVVQMTVNQFDGDEILTFSTVEKNQSIWL